MDESTLPTDGGTAAPTWEPPGGVLVWIVVFVETFTFGAALVSFAAGRVSDRAAYIDGRASLNQPLALTNTLVLLTGGWFMARALTTLQQDLPRVAARWIAAAAGSGVLFLLLKSCEYATKLSAGLGLHHDQFFTYYWLLTLFHYLHVAVAVAFLAALWHGVRSGTYTARNHFDVESGGVFWHMCDVIWLLLYATVYLLG